MVTYGANPLPPSIMGCASEGNSIIPLIRNMQGQGTKSQDAIVLPCPIG
jgi:hypothetical protein